MPRKQLFLILGSLFALASCAGTGEAATSHTKEAKRITTRMLTQLRKEGRIEASGTTKSAKGVKTLLRLRYQARDREDYQASPVSVRPHVGKPQSPHYIFVGRTRYVTLDGSRWYRTVSPSVPSALDALQLNTNGGQCCDAKGIRAAETLGYTGTRRWHGSTVFVVTYKGASASGGSYGNLYIDTTTYQLRGYSAHAVPDKVAGTFAVLYGGSFAINPPKM